MRPYKSLHVRFVAVGLEKSLLAETVTHFAGGGVTLDLLDELTQLDKFVAHRFELGDRLGTLLRLLGIVSEGCLGTVDCQVGLSQYCLLYTSDAADEL